MFVGSAEGHRNYHLFNPAPNCIGITHKFYFSVGEAFWSSYNTSPFARYPPHPTPPAFSVYTGADASASCFAIFAGPSEGPCTTENLNESGGAYLTPDEFILLTILSSPSAPPPLPVFSYSPANLHPLLWPSP
ncbi:hypothetical protein O181_028013 [Austropuccinia psidii MF-1]|uniref:Uncharacterized protein n=1 Tax=Austropuccinia psidii MF-1 TaxID=1389203 RepID=A0A9Q3CQP2_9BASI|nr:hypothetical protein [Austropuccinia psidii MF-1]